MITQLQLINIIIIVCVLYLRTNSDLCHLHHKLIGFYNRVEKCLLRGTNCVFKYSSLRLVFKGLETLDIIEILGIDFYKVLMVVIKEIVFGVVTQCLVRWAGP